MKTGPKGRALIQSFEKLRLKAYKPTPNDVPSIGWGHTKFVCMGDICTETQAEVWLTEDLAEAEACVILALDFQPTQEQFDACVSLCYNIGCAGFRHSSVVKFYNQGDVPRAAAAFMLWDKQHGQVLPGLVRRREAEMNLFLGESNATT